ncbi:MAG: SDR family oxidoreductase [Bacillota bacterium]|nr:SDR family oxidoreductase [Bacillota bacterium]
MREGHVLVTGGARGLGRRVALFLAERGYALTINYRESQKEAEDLVEAIRRGGGDAGAAQGDVGRPDEAAALVAKAQEERGPVDVLVHGAGPFERRKVALADTPLDLWQGMLEGNLGSAFYLCRALLPGMRERRFGRLIFFGFAEVEGNPGWPGRGPYAAAKAGLLSLVRTLSLEEAPYGITANLITPGDIRDPWKEKSIAEAVAVRVEEPLGRPGTGEDVARAVAFLAGKDAGYVTGSVVAVTGGLLPLRD